MPAKSRSHVVLLATLAAFGGIPFSLARAAGEHDHMSMSHDMPMTHAMPMEHAGHDHSAPAAAPAQDIPVRLSGRPLSDQEGRRLRLKDDVIGDRIVVVSFVYTSCTTVCPVVSSIFSDLQTRLGDRLDKDVRLISMTVDPATDTPGRLKSYAANYAARPGWYWLTGSSANVAEALKGFGAYTEKFENHPVVVMIGDGRTGKWSRHYGLAKSETLMTQIESYLAARGPGGTLTPTTSAAVAQAVSGS